MVKLIVVYVLIASLVGLAVGCSMVAFIEWLFHVKETRSRVRRRLDFAERHVGGGRNRLLDAAILDQRPEWNQPGRTGALRQSLNGKKTMEARWGA